jgi:phosphatidylinositol kinase/protein kinase (PI-3  family)
LEGEPEIKKSKTAPNILSYTGHLTSDPTVKSSFKLLCKFEDVRQDSIVTSLIRLAKRILDKETGREHCVITYNVIPTSAKSGFIECVQDARDFRQIEEEHINLANYLTSVNPSLYRPGKP